LNLVLPFLTHATFKSKFQVNHCRSFDVTRFHFTSLQLTVPIYRYIVFFDSIPTRFFTISVCSNAEGGSSKLLKIGEQILQRLKLRFPIKH